MHCRILFQLFCQPDTDLHAVDEAGAFVLPAEGTDWIHDLIHLPQRHINKEKTFSIRGEC